MWDKSKQAYTRVICGLKGRGAKGMDFSVEQLKREMDQKVKAGVRAKRKPVGEAHGLPTIRDLSLNPRLFPLDFTSLI